METLSDIVEFRSARFPPVLPEDSQVNPQIYGAELSYWLCIELARRGVVTSYPEYEDWGWYIEYTSTSGSEFAVHCGNVGGARDVWLLSLRPYARKLFGRGKAPLAEAVPLVSAIKAVVYSVAAAADIDWRWPEVELG